MYFKRYFISAGAFLVLTLLVNNGVDGADSILSYSPEGDLALINRDQQRELERMKREIESEEMMRCLENRKDSLQTSLMTHRFTYTDRQKAYKRLVVWYIDQRLKAFCGD